MLKAQDRAMITKGLKEGRSSLWRTANLTVWIGFDGLPASRVRLCGRGS